jgi:hypothetical protein
MGTKSEMLSELKSMLNDLLARRTRGDSYPRLLRAQGYIDGYMKALLDAGFFTQKELLATVAEERSLVHGPALAVAEPESDVEAVA